MDTNGEIAWVANKYIQDAASSSFSTRNQIIEQAFNDLQKDRQTKCLNDVAITSAEHYMFARYLVGEHIYMFAPLCEMVFPTYDLIKAIAGDTVAASKCPVSSYDYHHTIWKLYGCRHGSRDYWHSSDIPPGYVEPDSWKLGW